MAVLGPLEVDSGEGPVVLSAPKERAVLEMLALRAGRPVPVESLRSGLWGESPPPAATKAVQTYVSHLRRALPAGCVLTAGGGYLLRVDPQSTDAGSFERSVQEADHDREAGDPSSAALSLSGALALWRGQPCPDLDEHSWATAEVARLEELRRTAQEELAEARLEAGDHHAMVGDLEAAATEEPLRERRWAQLILALYRCGRQADALRSFARLRATLAEQLGISSGSKACPMWTGSNHAQGMVRVGPTPSRPG